MQTIIVFLAGLAIMLFLMMKTKLGAFMSMLFGCLIIGIGCNAGENRAIEAARQAVANSLLEATIEGATNAIVNVTGGSNLTLFEIEDAVETVRAAANNDVNIIFGAIQNDNLTDEVIVTVVATGVEEREESNKK